MLFSRVISRFRKIVSSLRNESFKKDCQIVSLKKQVHTQSLKIKELRSQLWTIELALNSMGYEMGDKHVKQEKEVKLDSHNSHLPPSTDIVKHPKKARPKSGRKRGGQPGHKGHFKPMTDSPDKIIDLYPSFCQSCGQSLAGLSSIVSARRQVVDIPPVIPSVTEYRQNKITCSCGNCQKANFPEEASNHTVFGNNICAFIVFLSVRQYIPYKRMTELMSDLLGTEISQGTVRNILRRASEKGASVYSWIKSKVAESEIVGADETPLNVGGDKSWAWVFQNDMFTYITVEKTRSKAVIEKHFPQGFPKSFYVSDRYVPHTGTPALGHQYCIAHILRDLIALEEKEGDPWACDMITLLCDATDLKKSNPLPPAGSTELTEIENRFGALLDRTLNAEISEKTEKYQLMMRKNKESILLFLYHKKLPPDNNSSERAIRNIKVKQKVSGQFFSGHNEFAVLRSLVDTFIKNKMNIVETLKIIFSFQPYDMATE